MISICKIEWNIYGLCFIDDEDFVVKIINFYLLFGNDLINV